MNALWRNGYVGLVLAICFVLVAMASADDNKPDLQALVDARGPGFKIRVVDGNGEPVEGALAGLFCDYSEGSWRVGLLNETQKTSSDGIITCAYGRNNLDGAHLIAWHEGRKLAGIVRPPSDRPKDMPTVEIVVRPAQRVHGRLAPPDARLGYKSPPSRSVCVSIDHWIVVAYETTEGDYDFLLPEGDFDLAVMGYDRYEHIVRRPLHIEPGESDLEIETIAPPPTQLGLLRGHAAPELRDVVAWKNSDGVMLSKLKGRYVLLDFWGEWCDGCVSMMPTLFAIHDRFPEDKLAIVGVHVGLEGTEEIDTVEKLDTALVDVRKELWGGRDLPFPVALVKAKQTPQIGSDEMAHGLAAADFGIRAYPTTVLIDPEGNVVGDASEYLVPDDGFAKLAKLLSGE